MATTVIQLNRTYRGETPDPAGATRDAMAVAKSGLLPIVEVFYSLQGEGSRSGEATVFVRTAGCNCDCWFCDTDFRVKEQLALDALVARVQSLGGTCRWACLTGGEPTIHALGPLCDALHAAGWKVQIETNGTRPQPAWGLDHITVSPKELQGARLDPWYYDNATEFKYVIDGDDDLAYARESRARHEKAAFLQPNALNPDAVALCIAAVQAEPTRFRLSLQTHKLLGIR
jgi:organic radical activating enzyme